MKNIYYLPIESFLIYNMIFDHTTKYNVLFACILSFSAELRNLYPKISTQKNEHYMELYIGKYACRSYIYY